jgi:hypothetical protein
VRPAPVDPSTILEIGDIAHAGSLAHVVEEAPRSISRSSWAIRSNITPCPSSPNWAPSRCRPCCTR